MKTVFCRPCRAPTALAIGIVLTCNCLLQADAYDAPTNYYSTATSTTGATLKTQLRSIISVMTPINYGDARYSAAYTDVDPNNSSNLLTVYSRKSLSSTWDSGATWNREHTWPQSRIGASASNGTANIASDQFEVRPSASSENSSRGNRSYGGTYGLGVAKNIDTSFFYPGDAEAGDVARGAFYMATRWSQLSLVNGAGNASANEMGDLAALLIYHYSDTPDTFERRRNHAIYGKAGASGPAITNPYAQGNRNPYVDHPEWVWAVFGDGANDSKLSVGTPAADGSSTSNINLGRVIVGGTASLTSNISITKTGTDPTYFSVTTSGLATSTITGTNNAFNYNAGSKALTVGLATNTSTVGVKTGSVVVDNMDITNQGTGTGALDGNDTVNLSLTVLGHSEASFSTVSNTDTLFLNLGGVDVGSSSTMSFSIANFGGALTAGLDLDSIVASGDTSMFSTNMAAFSALAGGLANSFNVTFSPVTQGLWSTTYVLNVSDENISGATTGTSLTLNVIGYGFKSVPEPSTLSLLIPLVVFGTMRRRS